MVQSTSGIQSSNAGNDFILNAPTSTGTADFAQQLLTAIEGLLQKSGNGSQFEIDIKPGQGQNSDNSQLTVTVKNLTTPASQTPAAPQAQPITLMSSVTIIPTSTSGTTSGTTSGSSSGSSSVTTPSAQAMSAAALANMTPDDAYWASQPPAVQALRNMPDDQRYSAAQELAAQGYIIDVPIMVNGMDPLACMIQRQIDGYTWVPSALQPNIPVGPGIQYVGGPAYDAKNPPAGSIKVTTDFAAGTNMKNSWISKKQITDSMAGITA
jgi:hypothetical protein